MDAFFRHERFAWQSLSGCAEPPENPYTDAFFDSLFGHLSTSSGSSSKQRRRWEDVISAWRSTSIIHGKCMSNLILLSLYKGRVSAAICDQGPHARRAQLGALGHLRVFLYVLSGAISGLASNGLLPPDALFMLDLSDRADTPMPRGVLKLASTSGACTASALPVPISLKGYDHNMLASRWYLRDVRPRWPVVPWSRKVPMVAWRGAPRPYSNCLMSGVAELCTRQQAATANARASQQQQQQQQSQQSQQSQRQAKPHAASRGSCACYVSDDGGLGSPFDAVASSHATQLAVTAACRAAPAAHKARASRAVRERWEHPRIRAVRMANEAVRGRGSTGGNGNTGGGTRVGGADISSSGAGGSSRSSFIRSGPALDVAFVPCSREAGCDGGGLVGGASVRRGWPFVENANFSGVLELDGYGWQAGLLSKLTLGSAVVTHPTLYPLWYDDLLIKCEHAS